MLPVRIFYASTISLFNYSSVLGLQAPNIPLPHRQGDILVTQTSAEADPFSALSIYQAPALRS